MSDIVVLQVFLICYCIIFCGTGTYHACRKPTLR